MVRQADLPTAVHLGRFAIQLGQGNFRRRRWVCHWNLISRSTSLALGKFQSTRRKHTYVKLHIEFVLEQVVNVPTLAEPLGTLLVRFQPEPIRIGRFVVLHILSKEKNTHLS